MRILIMVLSMIVLSSTMSFAQSDEDARDVINKFAKASKQFDKEEIFNSWSEINSDERIKAYMRDNYPTVTKAFDLRSLAYKAQMLQGRFSTGLGSSVSQASDTTDRRGSISNNDAESNSRSNRTNRDITRSSDISKRVTNRSRVSSGETVRRSPNSSRISNSRRAKNSRR